MNRSCDVLIIGAGILGCFAARSLSRYDLDVLVLEQREDVCCGITKANTGIIYQGYDQHPGSLKADLCRKGSRSFPSLCEELDVPYRKTGLLMLSFGPRASEVIHRKIRQGKQNGIPDIRLLDRKQVYQMEPLLCDGITLALYSENTYTVNPWELGIAAYENAASNHVEFRFGENVVHMTRENKYASTGGRFVVETSQNTYRASYVLCCAGLDSDSLWEMIASPSVRIVPLAADYLVFDKCAGDRIHHVVSVEPEEKGEGITLVPTVGGNILAGPTRRSPAKEAYTATDISGISELKEKCRNLIPSLPETQVIRSFGAVRPNPYCLEEDGSLSGRGLNDFVILEENGFYALIGIKTPGITCARELGDYLAGKVIASMPQTPSLNRSYSPVRKGILRFTDLAEKEAYASLNEDYFEMICRCEHISKGEVLEAIRRGAVTVDGIKRRTGAGMGRCQGGYCMEKILHLLSEQTGTDIYRITRDGPGSEILK